MKLSVLMPVYNERRTLREIVARVLAQQVPGIKGLELVIVDDASTDGSMEIIKQLAAAHPDAIRPVFQERNQGKGAAIQRAIQAASGDVAIIQDADLEYDPADYPAVLKPIIDGIADVVYGSRFMSRGHRRVLYYRHALGNKLLTTFSNLFTDLYLTDMETCYKAFRLKIMKTIPLRSKRFGIEPEITAKIARRKLRVYEVPIRYTGRTYAEGKKINWKDGLQALWLILKYWIVDDIFEGDYGHRDLLDLERAPNFTTWSLDLIKPYQGEVVLEVGAGIGNNVRTLMDYSRVIATDQNEEYLSILKNAFENVPYVSVAQWDVTQPPPPDLLEPALSCHPELVEGLSKGQSDSLSRSQFPCRGGSHACPAPSWPDEARERSRRAAGPQAWEPALLNCDLLSLRPTSVLCSNVLEHLPDDALALKNMRQVLEPGGRLILIVPQGSSLYCSLDEAIGHYRRYDRTGLQALLEQNGYAVEKLFSFNRAGVLGWILRGKLMKRKEIGRSYLKLFNMLVPVFRRIDSLLPWPGLSLVAIAKKQ
jgi:glycosyltransferase involved in cell wall biosynthesis